MSSPTITPSTTLVPQLPEDSSGSTSESSLNGTTSSTGPSPTQSIASPGGPSTTVVISLAAVLGLIVLISVVCGLSVCARRRRRRAQPKASLATNDSPRSDEEVLRGILDEKQQVDNERYHAGSTNLRPSSPLACVSTAPSSSISAHEFCEDTTSSAVTNFYSPLNSSSSPGTSFSEQAMEGAPLLRHRTSAQESSSRDQESSHESPLLEVQATPSKRDSTCTVALPTITEADEEEAPPPLPSKPPGITILPATPVTSHGPATSDTETTPVTVSSAPAAPGPASSHADVPSEDEKGAVDSEKTSMPDGGTRAEVGMVVQAVCGPSAGLETGVGGITPLTAMTPQYPDATTGQAARESTVISLSRVSTLGQSHPRFLAVLMDLQASDDQDHPPPYQPRPEGFQLPLPPPIPEEGPDGLHVYLGITLEFAP
ncbi:hypothetical protein GY45DRAFT_1368483 [Cubamyces sp. BRFM 1775]|nr:hypothetical protein GY45DRAFT_1368483 [Cubamyces sp. BRFM 1775]